MKPIFHSEDEMLRYFSFEVISENDKTRADKAWAMYITNYKGDGCMGCVAEMLTATKGSNKVTISNTGRVDSYVLYRSETGHVVPVSAERKTNGGRIESVESEFSKAETMEGKYVVYSLDVCNKSTSYLRRHVDAVVIPRKLFIEKLIEFNAIKGINKKKGTVFTGYGIQASSRKLFDWLVDYPIVYDRNAVYSDSDFDGLF